MALKKNILFFMVDQMQAQVLRSSSHCDTPNLDALAKRGVRFNRAYTPNAICSPARASLMTGLLPHNHRVTTVIHNCPPDVANLQTKYKHWAQHLEELNYSTGYFGKWHVEKSNDLKSYGWQTNAIDGSDILKSTRLKYGLGKVGNTLHEFCLSNKGYRDCKLYSIVDTAPEQRSMWVRIKSGMEWISEKEKESDSPWCCMISIFEPHDPFVCSEEYYNKIDQDALELSGNYDDPLENCPNVYKKSSKVYSGMSVEQKKEAMACYYGSISEIDYLFGKLMRFLSNLGVRDDTLIVFTSDHGELLGAHGLYTKNFGAYEEVYNIPLILAGPGISVNAVSDARVGLHDLAPTLCEYAGGSFDDHADSRSFYSLLSEPQNTLGWQTGFAEFYGSGNISITQHIYWDGPFKLIHNGFDEDEFYNLDNDPLELNNLIHDPSYKNKIENLSEDLWDKVRVTNNNNLLNSHYPPFRFHHMGPGDV